MNEPERARQGLSRRRTNGQSHVPFGARGGLRSHLSRLARGRETEEIDGITGMKKKKPKSKSSTTGVLSNAEAVAVAEAQRLRAGVELLVVNKATVRVGAALDSTEAPFQRLEVGEIVAIKDIVDPATQFPCPYHPPPAQCIPDPEHETSL